MITLDTPFHLPATSDGVTEPREEANAEAIELTAQQMDQAAGGPMWVEQ